MMKKYFFAVVMCCITFSSWAQKQLVVLHTNDTHSCVMPLNPNLADTAIADRGGFLRRVNMVKQERQKNPWNWSMNTLMQSTPLRVIICMGAVLAQVILYIL